MLIEKKTKQDSLTDRELSEFMAGALADIPVDDKKVLVIIPDSTRTAPLPLFYILLHQHLVDRVKKLDYLIALGTHQPMSGDAIDRLLGRTNGTVPRYDVYNHKWNDPAQLKEIGLIKKEEIENISGGLFGEDVVVKINKMIYDYEPVLSKIKDQ